MPLRQRCCVSNCNSEDNVSFHCIPANMEVNLKWKEILLNHTDFAPLSEYAVVCSKHFSHDSFLVTQKRKLLTAEAVPSIFEFVDENLTCLENLTPEVPYKISGATQTSAPTIEIKDLIYTNKCVTQKLRRLQIQYNKMKEELQTQKQKTQNVYWKHLEQITEDANQMNPRATFILDQIRNYKKKLPRWSEITIRHCIAWRFCSPKGYKFPSNSILKLPSHTTLKKYMGTDNKNLIKDRLTSEIKTLRASERVCSLILDDMAVREAVFYSKTEDRIFGLETIPQSHDEIGNKPVIANQLLCYVIQGMSTKYIIPASYHFHRHLNSKDLYKLTLDVLKLLSDCGFIVIRMVADNHRSHVALFKHFGNGMLKNVVSHPYNPGLELFFSFDHCHAIKNARNLMLAHDMTSSDGIISAKYLFDLAEIQEHLVIKPVRYLTKKHLYPSNLEKMKVNLAVNLFSPQVTAALNYLIHHGGAEYSHFKDCIATVKYMENMYKYFQIHDVSNKTQYIHQREPNTAPYTDIQDARLSWLLNEFTYFIADIQFTSREAGMAGLTNETAEALVFTARSTSLCIPYLIRDLNFHYVLTRCFSSDAVESIFANIRLRGGSNDLTDCRAAEYALRQILKSGLIENVNTSNTMSKVHYASTAKLGNIQENLEDNEISITLSEITIKKLEMMREFEGSYLGSLSIESAAIAFLCGYLIMKVEESVECNSCLFTLHDDSCKKTSPLLDLIYNQDRGKLNYPSSLPKQELEIILKRVIVSYLSGNPMFSCELHNANICNIIISKLIPPLLTNFCNRV